MGPRSPESPAYAHSGVKEMEGGDGNNSVCENSSSVATPSSVHLIGSPLERQLSDLSGSYATGSPLPANIPRNIFGSPRESPLTLRQPWRQAHSLSSPAPDTDGPRMPILGSVTTGSQNMIMVEERNGVGVEVMPPGSGEPEKMPIDVFESGNNMDHNNNHDRCPIVIVLMNPGFKSYELLQLWLDTKTDTVRDVLQTLRQSLPNSWSQDYDGLAQFRRDRLSQLINCLSIQQFAVVPYEIWVAKPWALSTEHTAKYAENLLEHLRAVGVINSNASSVSGPPRVGDAPAAPDGVLTLSEEAKRRVYAPDGILTHHHAIQFLSFGPPFEKPFERPPVFPSSVAVTNRHATRATSPPPVDRPLSPIRPSPLASPTNEDDVPLVSANFYTEIDIQSGVPQSRESPPRASSPRALSPAADSFTSFASSTKTPDFSTDASSATQESQDWDDGTIRMMNSNSFRDSRRFSLQSIASQCELTLNRRKGSSSKNNGRRFIGLRTCFAGLSCARRTKQEVVETEGGSEEFSAQGSAFSMSLGHDDTFGEHLLTLYEVDEEEDESEMPLLSTSGYAFDEYIS